MKSNKAFIRRINYYETDQMGVVHHSNYARFLEEFRMNYFNEQGIPYKELEESNIIIPVLSISSNFLKPAKFGQEIIIYGKITKFTGIRFTYEYEIYDNDTKELIHTATSSHCFLTKDFEVINLKKYNKDLYDKLLTSLEI